MELVNNQKAYGIAQVCAALAIGRTSVYRLLSSKQLRSVKIGRRTIVLAQDLDRYLASLPAVEPKA